jgi:hypothetical protein
VQREVLPAGSYAREGPVLHATARAGAEAIMNVSWRETGARETVEIAGDAGRVLITDLKGGSLVLDRNGSETRETFPPLPATHWGLVENLLAHVTQGTPLACDGEEGRKSSVILDIVSALGEDGAEAAVDYANPPGLDQLRALGLRLLE